MFLFFLSFLNKCCASIMFFLSFFLSLVFYFFKEKQIGRVSLSADTQGFSVSRSIGKVVSHHLYILSWDNRYMMSHENRSKEYLGADRLHRIDQCLLLLLCHSAAVISSRSCTLENRKWTVTVCRSLVWTQGQAATCLLRHISVNQGLISQHSQ